MVDAISNINGGQSVSLAEEKEQKRKVETKVNIGGAMLRSEGTSYGQATVGAEVTIPIGKKNGVYANAQAGLGSIKSKSVEIGTGERASASSQNPISIGGEIGFTHQVSPKVSVNAGVGVQHNKYPHTATSDETDFSWGVDIEEYPNGGDGIISGTMHEGTAVITDKTRSGETITYGTVGAKYSPNSKFSFGIGANLGKAKIHDEGHYIDATGTSTIYNCEKSIFELDGYIVEGIGKVTSQTVPLDYHERTGRTSKDFYQVTGSAEYNINKNLAVGVDGKVGTNSYVGGTIKFKF